MAPSSAPVFGKRTGARPAPQPAPVARETPLEPREAPADHAAFFAAVRSELETPAETRPQIVPRAFKAAFLAALVVGCALAGFNVTGSDGAARVDLVAGALGVKVESANLLPMLILLGLVGGARIAAMTVIGVNVLLNAIGQTSHAAYASAGAVVAAGVAVVAAAVGHPPAHGWPIELAAGAASGLLYRVFAGVRAAG